MLEVVGVFPGMPSADQHYTSIPVMNLGFEVCTGQRPGALRYSTQSGLEPLQVELHETDQVTFRRRNAPAFTTFAPVRKWAYQPDWPVGRPDAPNRCGMYDRVVPTRSAMT